MLCAVKFWQGKGLSNMPAFPIRMACAAFTTNSRRQFTKDLVSKDLAGKYWRSNIGEQKLGRPKLGRPKPGKTVARCLGIHRTYREAAANVVV
jgi:hypothetical protein